MVEGHTQRVCHSRRRWTPTVTLHGCADRCLKVLLLHDGYFEVSSRDLGSEAGVKARIFIASHVQFLSRISFPAQYMQNKLQMCTTTQ